MSKQCAQQVAAQCYDSPPGWNGYANKCKCASEMIMSNCCQGYKENYDPNKPVCDNQDDYNQAFRAALKYNNKQNVKQAGPWLYVYLVLYIIFFVWGVLLALQVSAGPQRTLHVVLAIVFAPAYVLAYYLGMLKK